MDKDSPLRLFDRDPAYEAWLRDKVLAAADTLSAVAGAEAALAALKEAARRIRKPPTAPKGRPKKGTRPEAIERKRYLARVLEAAEIGVADGRLPQLAIQGRLNLTALSRELWEHGRNDLPGSAKRGLRKHGLAQSPGAIKRELERLRQDATRPPQKLPSLALSTLMLSAAPPPKRDKK